MRIFCGRVANPNGRISENQTISVENDRIDSLVSSCLGKADIEIRNATAFPGLINIHDHLKYSWYKRIGRLDSYSNVYNWLRDLYDEFDNVFTAQSLSLLFKLGIYKQIFAATTTVVNHSRYAKHVLPPEKEYINIFDEFERELVVQPELLRKITHHPASFGQSISSAHGKALQKNVPFMIHAAEGSDGNTEGEIRQLEKYGALTPETILVHCINTSDDDLELVKKGGCSVVWCPYSSNNVIGKNAFIPGFLSRGINVCIGTDSSCSGSVNLLEELRYARTQYGRLFGEAISNSQLFDMVTINAARALMCENSIGQIESGYSADIVIVESSSSDPYDDIINSTPESIVALLCNGRFVYGDEYIANILPIYEKATYTRFAINGRKKMIVGDPERIISSTISQLSLDKSIWFPYIPIDLKK